MVEVAHDIKIIENALIALNKGAANDKFAALHSLEKLLIEKKDALLEFELLEACWK